MTRLMTLAAALLLATGCWEPPPPHDSGVVGTSTDVQVLPCEFVGVQPAYANAGSVRGHVTSPSGTVPVLSSIVEVDVNGEVVWMLTQCDGGAFDLELPPGAHQVRITKGRWSATRNVVVQAGAVHDLGHVPLEAGSVAIAVIDGDYDDVGALMGDAGIPFTSYGRPRDLLDDPVALDSYEVLFVNCGTLAGRGLDPYTQTQADTVRAWIEAGGTLYASDWEHELIELALPEAVDFGPNPRTGVVSIVDAQVLDRDIQTILRKDTAQLQFNLTGWAKMRGVLAAFPLVMAVPADETQSRPMAVIHMHGAGKAFYTSFHNERQITQDMEILLYEMILSL